MFRFSLTDKGHRFDSDEFRFVSSVAVLNYASHGEFKKAARAIFDPVARPGYALMNLPPVLLQRMLYTGDLLSPSSVRPYDVVSWWNAVITLIISLLLYRILLLAAPGPGIALAGTIAYSLLVNTNLYIRHLFPYDMSLMFFLLVLLWILRAERQGRMSLARAAACGALSTFGALVYPGYYGLVAALAVVLVAAFRNWGLAVAYGLASIALINVTEVCSRVGEWSYFDQCRILMPSVNHGSFAEGFLYVFRYMRDVEGVAGLVILAGFVMYVGGWLRRDRGPVPVLLGMVALLYAAQAISGLLFQKFVFYGRTLHMYFPFLVLGVVRLLSFFPAGRVRRIGTGVLLLSSMVSFAVFAAVYPRLAYPADLFFAYKWPVSGDKILWVGSDQPVDVSSYRGRAAVVVNFDSYWVLGPQPVDPGVPDRLKLQLDKPHPLNFSAYTFENYSDTDRALIKQRAYRMRLYVDPAYLGKQ